MVYEVVLQWAAIFFTILIFVWYSRGQGTIERRAVMAFLSMTLLLNVGYLFELMADNGSAAFMGRLLSHGGLIFMGYFICLFFCYFVNGYVPMWVSAYIFLYDVLMLVLVWTSRWHELIFRNSRYGLLSDGRGMLTVERGELYIFLMLGCEVLPLAVTLTMIFSYIRREHVAYRRRQIVIMAVVVYLSYGMALLFSSRALPFHYNFAGALCMLSADAFVILFQGKGGFNLGAVSGDKMFASMREGIIVTDASMNLLKYNQAAKRVFPELEPSLIHHNIRLVHSIPLELFDEYDKKEVDFENQHYEVRRTIIRDYWKEIRGYVLILDDQTMEFNYITEIMNGRKKAEKVEKDALRALEEAKQANRAKSDFLANVSHEIRTPMNAIVGMTEILLRSDLSDQDRGYLMNIKNSGASLLTIINDILDFSKIESGKLEIIPEEYEPMSMLSDLSMIFLNRIGDKPIELMFDIDRKLPNRLYGDSLRIRQVIINIANNAIKFTEAGFVRLTIRMTHMEEEDMVNLDISIQDSGQGIKEEDLDKLFGSFQQVDTKKNRNKEGTGLGLAISKQLVENMGGQIGVKSEYGKGSEFYFNIPQKVIGTQLAAVVKEESIVHEPMVVSGHMGDERILEQLKNLAEGYGLRYVDCYEARDSDERVDFFFVDESIYQELKEGVEKYFVSNGTELCVLQNPMRETVWNEQALVINKPLYTLNFCQVINHETTAAFVETDNVMNFIAPQAQILIVDDNEMNLKVAKGLLQPLQMNIDTASSGKQAIAMVQEKRYHIVFMDHMMPVMDGVETTQNIRKLPDEYIQNMPIIALTANAVMGAREIFKEAGMNDFVAKPIELKDICSKIRAWLPKELIRKLTAPATAPEQIPEQELPEIEGLDVAEGIKNSGSLELFMNLLGDFYKLIDLKSTKIEKCLADGMIRDYTIEVHALKNTARMIGAMELSELFYKMEQCGNAEDVETISRENPAIMELYRSYKPILEPYGKANEQDKKEVPKEEIIGALDKLNAAMDSFDLDGADAALAELEEYRLPEELGSYMEELRAYVADVAMEDVMNTGKKMIEVLEGLRHCSE